MISWDKAKLKKYPNERGTLFAESNADQKKVETRPVCETSYSFLSGVIV